MQIAVISDTHLPRGSRRLPEACVERLRAADLILHAGDLMRLTALRELESYGPVVAVHGNVDDSEVRAALPAMASVDADGLDDWPRSRCRPGEGARRAAPPAIPGRRCGRVRPFAHTAARAGPRRISDFQPGKPNRATARIGGRASQFTMGIATVVRRAADVRAHRRRLTDWPDGPLGFLRRHCRIDPDRATRVAGGAGPPRRRPHPVRLRRGDAATARAIGRADGADRGVPDPLPRRSLARPPGAAEDVRPARPRAAARDPRAPGPARVAHARPPRRGPSPLRARADRACAGRPARARRLQDRAGSGQPPGRATRSAT